MSAGVVVLLSTTSSLFAGRISVSLNEGWTFARQDVAGAESSLYDDRAWQRVDVPHSWNGKDGYDDQPGYYRGVGWYRKRFELDPSIRGGAVELNVESACLVSDVWLNGHHLGPFLSGYVGFRVDISDHLDFSESGNVLVLKVDNSNNPDIPPWNVEDFKPYPRAVDFNVYGGINSDVYLLITDPLHIDSVHLETPGLTRQAATVQRTIEVENRSSDSRDVLLVTEVIDAQGIVVEKMAEELRLGPRQLAAFVQKGQAVSSPRLWSPTDPYLYRLRSRLVLDGEPIDEVETPFGMRWIEWKPFSGLHLNGEKVYLRGASRHQEFPGQGNAMSNAQHVRDMELIKSMGANYVRLAHYPQDPAVLEACDRLGLLVWEEIPVAISISGTPEFNRNALVMLRRMIRRDRNHPSIVFWGLMNETTEGLPFVKGLTEQDVVDLMRRLNELARAEDPTRLTLASGVTRAVAEQVDIDVPQFWRGWFEGELTEYGELLDERHRTDPAFMGGSYGASSQVGRHTENPKPLDFSETYQCILHESYIRQGQERSDWYTGACIWTAFDFASNREDRASNPLPYVNQKGLFDAYRNPKDVYYLYKSYWTEDPLFVYIVSKTWTERSGPLGRNSLIRVYSNCPRVELLLNGVSQGILERINGFTWQVQFEAGVNELKANGLDPEGTLSSTDELKVTYGVE